jgi:hypothetical protein
LVRHRYEITPQCAHSIQINNGGDNLDLIEPHELTALEANSIA